jgi:hypothetical protein
MKGIVMMTLQQDMKPNFCTCLVKTNDYVDGITSRKN